MKTRENKKKMMKAGAASKYLGISVRYLHDLRNAGRLPFYRVGPRTVLFSEADLEKFLADTRIGGRDDD